MVRSFSSKVVALGSIYTLGIFQRYRKRASAYLGAVGEEVKSGWVEG
jgi:hypothetical protein